MSGADLTPDQCAAYLAQVNTMPDNEVADLLRKNAFDKSTLRSCTNNYRQPKLGRLSPQPSHNLFTDGMFTACSPAACLERA